MLKIKKLTVGEMAENCYLLYSPDNKELIIIDPGDEADYIERIISDLGLKPQFILLTHGHWDHLMAAGELSLAYKIPVYMSKQDEFLLMKATKMMVVLPKINKGLRDDDNLRLGSVIIKVLAIPGHTPGSLAYLSQNHLFSGDLLFAGGGLGRTDFAYANKTDFEGSLSRVKKLSKGMIIHPGHGEDFQLQ